MIITAKRNSPCSACGKPMKIGDEIEYNPVEKKARHIDCNVQPAPSINAGELADQLGYIEHGAAVCADWPMLLLSRGTREPARRNESEAREERDPVRSLFESAGE